MRSKRSTKALRPPIETVLEPHPNNLRGVPFNRAYPEKAIEWYYPKNCGFGPEDFSYGSNVIAWWKCDRGHVYDMSIAQKSKSVTCPYCHRSRINEENCLAKTSPKVAKQWHPVKNGKLTAEDVIAGSHTKVWWQCAMGHAWKTSPKARTAQGSNCPKCYRLSQFTLTDYPLMMKMFDRAKNKGLKPDQVTTVMEVWWRCNKGSDHSWQQIFRARAEKLPCPFCNWEKVSKTNSLHALHPKLAKELHPTKNGKLTAKDLPAQTSLKVWWKCAAKPRHVWQTSVRNRCVNKSGCPECWSEKRAGGYFKELAAERMKQAKKKKST